MTPGRAGAGGRAPRHLQAARTTTWSTSTPWASAARRCPRSARSARLAIASRARGAERAWQIAVDGGVKSVRRAGCARRRHAGRGARPVLRHAGAPQVPEDRRARNRTPRRRSSSAWPWRTPMSPSPSGRGAAGAAPAGDRRRPLQDPAAATLERLGAIMGREFADNARAARRDARGRAAHRLRRPADLQPRHRDPAIPVRQRPAGEGPPAHRRDPRRLSGFPGARPPSDGGAVRRSAGRRGRRQRASGQGRGALPRRGAGARPDRQRPAPGAGGGGASRLHHGRGQHARLLSPRRAQFPTQLSPPSLARLLARPCALKSGLGRAGDGRLRALVGGDRRPSARVEAAPSPDAAPHCASAGRRPRPGARDLHRRPDRATAW